MYVYVYSCIHVRACVWLVCMCVRDGVGGGYVNACVKLFMHCVCFSVESNAYTSNYPTIVRRRHTPHAHTRVLNNAQPSSCRSGSLQRRQQPLPHPPLFPLHQAQMAAVFGGVGGLLSWTIKVATPPVPRARRTEQRFCNISNTKQWRSEGGGGGGHISPGAGLRGRRK